MSIWNTKDIYKFEYKLESTNPEAPRFMYYTGKVLEEDPLFLKIKTIFHGSEEIVLKKASITRSAMLTDLEKRTKEDHKGKELV